jgi:endogenous inhibitor of DNA gyrase (YacG/DUF329 family)
MGKKNFIPHDIENDYYVNYSKKDNRYRAMNKRTHETVSYPRLIMENYLERYLNKNEDVHHKDGDKTNNNINNLEIVNHNKHVSDHNYAKSKIYYDEIRRCPVCNVWFQWTDKQQKNFYRNKNRKKSRYRTQSDEPFCSKKCAGIYSRRVQLSYNK